MIAGIGIDIVDIARLTPLNDKLAKKVLKVSEYNELKRQKTNSRKIEFFGGRIAAKEAFVKALGTGFRDISFQDIEVLTTELGAPYIVFHHELYTNQLFHLSITHSATTIVAVVIIEKNEEFEYAVRAKT